MIGYQTDLPMGAVECKERRVVETLKRLAEKDKEFHESGLHYATHRLDFLEGLNSKMASIPLPKIRGRKFYSRFDIKTGNGEIYLFVPGAQRSISERKMQRPRIFTAGEVSDEEVRDIVETYSNRMTDYINRTMPNGGIEDTD